MGLLTRKGLRDLRATRGQGVCLAVLTAVVVVLVAGGMRARTMLIESRDAVYERLAHADLELRFSPTHPGVAAQAALVEGVAEAEERLLLKAVLEVPEARPLPALVRVLPSEGDAQLERLEVMEGRLPHPGEIAMAVDRSLVGTHGLGVGDRVGLVLGEQVQDVPIVGVFLSPEHVLWPVHPEYALPLRGTVAVVAISTATAAVAPAAKRIDSLLVKVVPGAEPAQVRAALRERLFVSVVDAPLASERPGHVFTERLLAIFDIYMPSTAAMMLVVALGLLVLTVARMLAAQRKPVGIQLTLGYRPTQIAGSLAVESLVPVAAGIVVGGLTHGMVARGIFAGYAGSIGYVPLKDPGVGSAFFLVSLGCLLLAGLAALVPAWCIAQRRPAALLRPAGRHGIASAQGVLVRGAAWLRERLGLPLSLLVGMTTVFRRRAATLVAVIGLGISFALVIAFLLVHVTHRNEVEASAERMGLDATVHFENVANQAALDDLAARAEGTVEAILSERVWLATADGGAVRRTLLVPPGAWLGQQRLVAGRRFTSPQASEILIDRWIAREQGLAVGDQVTVYPYPDAPEGATVEVVGVLEGLSAGFAVLPIDTGRPLFQMDGLATGAHVRSPLPADELTSRLWKAPGVEAVFALAPAVAQVRANFEGSERMLLLVLLMAAGVAVVFLGALAWLDAKDRARDLALLSAIGWRSRSLLALSVSGVMVRGVLAIGLAALLAPLLARFLLARLAASDLPRMALETPAWPFVVVLGTTLLLLPLGAWPAYRSARRIPPARALRLLGAE